MTTTLAEYLNAVLRERLYSRAAPCPDPGCECLLRLGWVSRHGYGQISVKNKHRGTHQVAWELDNGPVPPGHWLDHVKARGCRHRHCLLLAHLEPVTYQENILRGDTIAAAHAAKTHCPQGHPYDEANTYMRLRVPGRYIRICRACSRTAKARAKARLKREQDGAMAS
jgi:hypothetical protein